MGTLYVSEAVRPAAAQQALDEHITLTASGRCRTCSVPGPCVWREAATVAFVESGCLPRFCLLTASQDAVDAGLVNPAWRIATPATVEGRSLAYRSKPCAIDEQRTVFEHGAYGTASTAPTSRGNSYSKSVSGTSSTG
jgi:hypothetical protein